MSVPTERGIARDDDLLSLSSSVLQTSSRFSFEVSSAE